MRRNRASEVQAQERIQYSFVPNHRETMQALALAKFSNQEFRVIIALLNQTDGYLREEDELSSSFWQALTFMGRQSIHATLGRLVSLGIITKNGRKYKVNHPNAWAPEVFKPQRITQRSLTMAQSLLTRERHPHHYRWLANLLKPSLTSDGLKVARGSSKAKASLTSDGSKTSPGAETVSNQRRCVANQRRFEAA